MKNQKWLLILISLFFVSCGDDNFTERSKLGELRVLALSADTPEINSATTVTLTPLISYVEGGDTTLNYEWEACPDPGIDFGAEVSCDSSPAALKLTGSGSFSTTALSGSFYTGNSDDILLSIPPDAFVYLSTLSSDLQYNGINYLFVFQLRDSGNTVSTKAIKRIKLSTKPTPELNVNPSMGAIQFEGASLTTYPDRKGEMSVSSLSSSENYNEITNVGLKAFSEKMYVSWFSSSGEFLYDRTDVG
jgi:hypothetical protein